jgi:hypothetical protein
VTSSSDAADKSAPGGDDVAIDREFERMWFVVPAGTPDGAALDVETQIAQRLIGYDHREEYSTGYYAKPFGAVGSFAILKRRPDALLIGFNVIVMPKDRRNIVVRGIREVPIATNGLHARPAPAAK